MSEEDVTPTEEEREEIRRAYAPLTRQEEQKLKQQFGAPQAMQPDLKTYEREDERTTRMIRAAYGIEWMKSVTYSKGLTPRNDAIVWRYAAMEELNIPLTPEIRRWYGPMIADHRKKLPKRRDA